MKKIISVILSIALCIGFASVAFAEDFDVTISNPYENINWDSVTAYKTALHTHTNASDGTPTLYESLERHAEAGFDIVATTDHGTVNYTWADPNQNPLIYGALSLVGKSEGELQYLGTEGTFCDGTISYTYGTDEATGDDFLTLSNGQKILRVPYGIENNAVSVNAHVNGFFADYHDNTVTTYEDAVRGVSRAGGVCVINHPGEYTKARYALTSDEAYDDSNFAYGYYMNKYAYLLDKYDCCIGLDINSKGDSRTRFERVLWDNLLCRFAQKGENVYAIASSDAHNVGIIDSGYTLLLMEEQTSAAARAALENGEFFAASHQIGNYDELVSIAASLKEFYGETELYTAVQSAADAIYADVVAIQTGEKDADSKIDHEYDILDANGYCTADTHPQVSAIAVDDDANTITINSENALILRVISGGKLIDTVKAGEATINLADYADELSDYVRFELFGEGGVLYTQAFLLNAEQNAQENGDKSVIKGVYVNLGFLDFLFAELNNLFNIISRWFSNLF